MSRIEFDWPDASAERVRAAEGRLRLAGEALRARHFEERLAATRAVLEDWTRPDSPWRRELAEGLAEVTPFAAPTIREGLASALQAWRAEDFGACAMREIGAQLEAGRRLAPFSWTTVIAGGAIPMPTLLSSLLPLVLGSPVLLRETRRDTVTPSLVARSLAQHDEGLARAFEPIAFASDDAAAMDVALSAPCVVATGSDETLTAIAKRLTGAQRLVGYGHRFSIGVIGPALGQGDVERIATGLALDVARWDQSGCLSLAAVYLVGLDASARQDVAEALADALEALSTELPRGALEPEIRVAIANERAAARMRLGEGRGAAFEGPDYTVLLETDAQHRPAPLGRFVRLLPVASLSDLFRTLEPFAGHLSNVCLEGFETSDSALSPATIPGDAAAWDHLGVSRFTDAGRLQTPPVDWPHDGSPVFGPLARFATESGVAGSA